MEVPVLITQCCCYNFLREFWLSNRANDSTAQEIIKNAKEAYNKLAATEVMLYKQDVYVGHRLLTDFVEMQDNFNKEENLKRRRQYKAPVKNKLELSLAKRSWGSTKPKRPKTRYSHSKNKRHPVHQ